MRELSSSAFPLGETSLHLLHTPDGNMFVTADLAVKLFDSAPATFADRVPGYFSLAWIGGFIIMFVGILVPMAYMVYRNKKAFKRFRD